jgi:hypothetical protein
MTTKLKEALFYAIHRNYYAWRVVAVTTHKSSGRWHGRYVADNETTHGTGRDLIGKFDTAEAALERVAAVTAVKDKWEPLIEANREEGSRLYRKQQEEMEAVVGEKPEDDNVED